MTPISVHVRAPHGLRKAAVFVEQNGVRYQAWASAQPSLVTENTWNLNVGTTTIPQLKDGTARLIVEATSDDWLRKRGALGGRRDGGDESANRECRF